MADTKASRGLAATGVGTVDCARHNMKRPNGVGDLQKGEKYVILVVLPSILISYTDMSTWTTFSSRPFDTHRYLT
jgi:hypothetical protein